MKRTLLSLCALIFLASCSNSTGVAVEKEAENTGRCAPSAENPTLGLSAITDEFRVRVWDDPTTTDARDLEQIAGDPSLNNSEYDITVVESVAVSAKDCTIFVGACCEPVSGITFYEGENKGEWLQLIGHLPTVSPDGELLALVGYEELTISSVANPDKVLTTIALPKADVATIYRAQWINNDDVALSGFTNDGAYLWIASQSTKSLREGVQISDTVDNAAHGMSLVGLIGVDENNNVVTQNMATEQQTVVEYRYPDSLAISSSDTLSGFVRSYVMRGERSVMVSDNGVLTTWFGNGNPLSLAGKYNWAG
jgi:hypothetical protein